MRALGGISKISLEGSFAQEYRFHKKDRGVVWLRDEMRFVQADRKEAEIVGTLTDVSEKKKVESELLLKGIALDAAANTIVITDRDGTIQWLNPASELLTNALAHAYPGESPFGDIRVSIRRMGDLVELGVRDDSLGMILVRILAEQLRGKLEFRSYDGTEAILRFSIS